MLLSGWLGFLTHFTFNVIWSPQAEMLLINSIRNFHCIHWTNPRNLWKKFGQETNWSIIFIPPPSTSLEWHLFKFFIRGTRGRVITHLECFFFNSVSSNIRFIKFLHNFLCTLVYNACLKVLNVCNWKDWILSYKW